MVMKECRNFWDVTTEDGQFSLSGGQIQLCGAYKVGQYILLTGSLLVDGLYQIIHKEDNSYTLDDAPIDEEWHGTVYGLRVPADFIRQCMEIKMFRESEQGQPTIYDSETVLGVHSWSRGKTSTGEMLTWKHVFATGLTPYRRMFSNVRI